VQRKPFRERVLEEMLQEPLAYRRDRRNLRGVKRKMSNWPLRRCHAKPPPSVIINQAIRVVE
jgi:hypothetical protein